jgi:hypothetical protein
MPRLGRSATFGACWQRLHLRSANALEGAADVWTQEKPRPGRRQWTSHGRHAGPRGKLEGSTKLPFRSRATAGPARPRLRHRSGVGAGPASAGVCSRAPARRVPVPSTATSRVPLRGTSSDVPVRTAATNRVPLGPASCRQPSRLGSQCGGVQHHPIDRIRVRGPGSRAWRQPHRRPGTGSRPGRQPAARAGPGAGKSGSTPDLGRRRSFPEMDG